MGTAAHNRLLTPSAAYPLARHCESPAPTSQAYARFVILSAPLRGLEMVLKPQAGQRHWTLGSASGVDFYIRDRSLLDNHLSIEWFDDVWLATTRDQHGIWVNGEPMETSVIEDGDRLLVGRFELVFLEPTLDA